MAITLIEGSGNIQYGSSYNQSGDVISIYNGGTTSNFTIGNGVNISIGSGGTTNDTIVNGGKEYITSGVANNTIVNNGSQIIQREGSANNPIINAGGTQSVANGAIVNNASINGGRQLIALNAVASNTSISNGGVQSALMGTVVSTTIDSTGTAYNIQGKTSNTIINNGGTLIAGGIGKGIAYNYDTVINAGGQAIIGSNVIKDNTLGSAIDYNAQIHGTQTVLSGSIASNATIFNGGVQTIQSGGYAFETIVSNGGLLNILSGGKISSTITVKAGGSAAIYNDAGGAIDLVDDGYGGIIISGLADGGQINTVFTVIEGFNGVSAGNSDIITLSGIKQEDIVSVDYVDASGAENGDYVTLTLKNGKKITLHIIGAKNAGYALGSTKGGDLTYEVCFLTGTMIKTPDGEKAIENLRIGDQVFTFDWKNNKEIIRPICWIGSKKTTVNINDPADKAGYPVRILKNAIADGIPYKDLLVTPEHCLFFQDKFIPARMLINGSSIYYDYSITEYTYYHIETEEHSIIWADGALTESYLDTGNRQNFTQHGNLVLFHKPSSIKDWNIDAGAPLIVQRSIVEPIYNQIVQRADNIDSVQNDNEPSLTKNPNLYLVTQDNQIIKPHFNDNGKYIFSLPENVKTIYLHSRTSRPCDIIGPFIDDRRDLGVLISDIFVFTYDKIYQIKDHLVQENLKGWDVIEQNGYRWTNGHAELNLHQQVSQKRIMVVQTIATNSYIIDHRHNDFQKQNIA